MSSTSMPDASSKLPVAVVGGGLAGLAAAWKLKSLGVPAVGFEASARLGGLIQTERWEDSVYEHGPDGFLLRRPQAKELCDALGVPLQPLSPLPQNIYIASRRGIFPLPKGLGLLVPTDWLSFFTSPLLSPLGRLRLALEPWLGKRPPTSSVTDESLASFIRRRFGREAYETLAEPLLGGVWNTDPEILSLRASFPHYADLEQSAGSVLRGLGRSQALPVEGGGLASPVGGMGTLIEALEQACGGIWQTRARVRSIQKLPQGFWLDLGSGQGSAVRGVLLALPPRAASELVQDLSNRAGSLLSDIPSGGIGTLSMTLRAEDFYRPLDAWGVLFTKSSGSLIDGFQWSSSKWGHRSGADRVVVRAFFGGFKNPGFLDADNVVDAALEALRPWLKASARPLHTAIRRWQTAFPQIKVGHLERLGEVEALLPPEISLAGQGYRGVGMPAVIASAFLAAQKWAAI
ncbi:MAG: protoporphyrinogen oxidase [Spirochaetales bacterium]|nr:protoporphyrinogen oxidase [Spirochaetales bacterium]